MQVNTDVICGLGIPAPMDSLSSRLRQARELKGWSQTELAKRAGLSQGTVGNVESGTRGGSASLALLAEALGVRYRWLRDGEGEMLLPSPALWPFTHDLHKQVLALDAEALRRAENVLRTHFDMDALPRPEALAGKQPALAA